MEISPVTVPLHEAGWCCQSPFEPLTENKYAWTAATHLLFVEQPIGVGFSRGSPPPQNEDDLSGDFAAFLTNFYHVFPEYQSSDLFLFGESYAGMYVPSIARRLVLDSLSRHAPMKFPVKGIALGNGWVDAATQGPAAVDYAYWHGMMDSYTRDNLHALFDKCVEGDGDDLPEPMHPFNTPDDCGMMTAALQAGGYDSFLHGRGPNTYDVTTWDGYLPLLAEDNVLRRFLNNPVVQKKLHVPEDFDVSWRACMPGAGRRRLKDLPGKTFLVHDQPESSVPYIAELLSRDIQVLIYNGDRDLSTNAQGSERCLNDMEWSDKKAWYKAPRGLWIVNNESAGYIKHHKNLQFLVVYNSGHLAPYNVPVQALDLITRFVNGKSFHDYDLPSFELHEKTQAKRATRGRTARTDWFLVFLVAVGAFVSGVYATRHWNDRRQAEYERIETPGNGTIEETGYADSQRE
jgi:hypothetical protein